MYYYVKLPSSYPAGGADVVRGVNAQSEEEAVRKACTMHEFPFWIGGCGYSHLGAPSGIEFTGTHYLVTIRFPFEGAGERVFQIPRPAPSLSEDPHDPIYQGKDRS